MHRCYSAALFLLCVTALSSCHKDLSGPVVYFPGYDPTGLHALMAPLRSSPQEFSVTAGTYSSIVGAAGTELRFYPHSFKNADGSMVTGGKVDISLQEMYTAGEMISNSASTLYGGSPLISAGQIHIVASQNGQILDANKYGIRFLQPDSSRQPMNLYTGGRNKPDSVVTWVETLGTGVNGTTLDSLQNNHYYRFDSCTKFNWINCDYFSNTPGARTNLTASLPNTTFNFSNTYVWIVFPTLHSIGYLNNYDDRQGSAFSLLSNYFIPVGIKFHVALISNNDGTWYYAEQKDLTAIQGHTLSLTPAKKSVADIKEALRNL